MMHLLPGFFTRQIEQALDIAMDYESLGEDGGMPYLRALISTPSSYFAAEVVGRHEPASLTAETILRFSSLFDAYKRIPRILHEERSGLTYQQLGSLLQNDGIERTQEALRKYGEQQGKLAVVLGLARRESDVFLPSALGDASIELQEFDRRRLLERLVLRLDEIQVVIRSCQKQDVVHLKSLFNLSDSMYLRSRSSYRALVEILSESEENNYLWLEQKVTID